MSHINGGKPEWISLRDLEPHPELQRAFDQRRADRYVAEFNPAALGVLTVVETKQGRRWLIDGQHRRYAALQFVGGDGAQQVRCIVHTVLDDAGAAKLCRQLNDYKRWHSLRGFLNRIIEKDATALAIAATLDRYGLRVSVTRGEGTVQAVETMEAIYTRQRGPALLDATVRLLWNAWGNDPDAFHAQLLRGVALFLGKYGQEVDDTDLFRKLAKSGTPLALIGRSRELKSIMGVQLPHAVSECVRRIYNKGKRSGGLGEIAA